MTQWKLTILAVLALTSFAVADDQEKKIKRADLPPAVEKTVAAVSHGATIKGFSQEVENGQTLYEAEMTVNGHGKDVNIDSSGAVVEVEEQVEMDSLPATVKDGLKPKPGTARSSKSSPSPSTTNWWLMKPKFGQTARNQRSKLVRTASRSTTKSNWERFM